METHLGYVFLFGKKHYSKIIQKVIPIQNIRTRWLSQTLIVFKLVVADIIIMRSRRRTVEEIKANRIFSAAQSNRTCAFELSIGDVILADFDDPTGEPYLDLRPLSINPDSDFQKFNQALRKGIESVNEDEANV